MDNTIFTGNRIESFKFEKLILSGTNYVSGGYITDDVEDASITIDFDRDIIGSAKFTINNDLSINYLADRIKIYYSLGGYYFPLGVYMPVSPLQHLQNTDVVRKVQAYDLLKALEDDKVTTSFSLDATDVVTDEIKTILDSVGTWVQYNIEPSTEILPENKTYEIGTSKLFIINSLLNMINYYPLFCTGNGIYSAIPWSDSKNVTWDFQDNNLSLYESDLTRDIDYSNAYNKVLIIANQLASSENLYKAWTMEEEGISTHPFSYTNIARYVTKVFYSEATSQDYVDLRARREIRKMLEISETLDYPHAFVTARENDGLPYQGDHYKFKNTELDVYETYKIIRQDWTLDVGQSIVSKIRRVTEPNE